MFIDNLKYFVAITLVALLFSTSAFAQVPTGWETIQNTMDSARISFSTAAAREGSYGMEIYVDGDYGDSVTFKLNGLDLGWVNELRIDAKISPTGFNPLVTARFGFWNKDTVIYALQNSFANDDWAELQLPPEAWMGTLSHVNSFSITIGYYPDFGTGPKTLMMDKFNINIGSWQIFYTAGDYGTIQGSVFNDTSSNGLREVEDGLAGIEVYLTGTHIDSVLTDSLGNYKFPNLSHGSYTVTSPVSSGWFQTAPIGGSYSVTIGPDTLFYIGDFGNFSTTAKSFRVQKGWNIVSVPLAVADYSVSALYPSATTVAYAFDPNSGYIVMDTLENGPGYWLKFSYDHYIFMDGDDVTSDTVTVTAGWNLIGALSTSAPVTNITSDDPEMTLLGGVWEFGSSYKQVDTLVAGHGHWVKVSKTGSIMFNVNPPSGTTAFKVPIIPDDEMPPLPPGGEIASPAPSGLAMTTGFQLAQNYPNPFNPVTRIGYEIASTTPGGLAMTRLVVYNLLGQEVATLVNDVLSAGNYAVEFNASKLPSGVYIYRLQAGSHIATNKMILLR